MDDAEVDAALRRARAKFKRLQPGEYDLSDATGVLSVRFRKGANWHVVMLWAGRVIDGNGEHWLDPDDYFAHSGGKPAELLVRLD
jgi:hypothetical protein